MRGGRVGGFAAAALLPLACVALGAIVGGDPMLAVELAGGALWVLWMGLVVRDLIGSRRLAHLLSIGAHEAVLFGVACRVTPALGADALVVGSVRPRIYIGTSLVDELADDELEAVLFHEDHHRRIRAPIRAAALAAWLHILGRSQGIRDIVFDRLADLETLADADAIRRGSTPASLARALMKGDLSMQPVAFSYTADRRVERLLDRAAGVPIGTSGRLPYEWLPVALLAVATLGCHAGL